MIDLTKIEKPYGLLDKETQDALKAHSENGGEIQRYYQRGWMRLVAQAWDHAFVYRAKPEPVVKEYTHRQRIQDSAGYFEPMLSGNCEHGWVDGTTKLTIIDGKPARLVWEADQ